MYEVIKITVKSLEQYKKKEEAKHHWMLVFASCSIKNDNNFLDIIKTLKTKIR